MKYATDEAMRTGMTLQKSYIDNGDSTNARALDDAKRELKASIDQNSHDIKSVSKKVDPLIGIGSAKYYVAEYAKGSNDNTEIRHLGNKDILNNFGFVLLDTSDNKNITTKPKRLKDNNLLRFEDGTFAPTVGITTEQYNQCMANDIYTMDMDESSNPVYTLRYQAGQFDAVVQWKIDRALIRADSPTERLFILVPGADGASGTYKKVTHVLRPWETTETKYTIGIANLVDMYLLDNQVGDSGAYWKGIFLEPISWDGIDVTKHKLPPTAIGPCPVTTIQENGLIKTRNFFYLYNGITNCQSDGGLLPNHDFWEKNRTYPRVNDMNQVNNMVYARNNNYDVTKPYPFAEGGYHATNVFITALELLAGTRYLHQANLFGSGISSNSGLNDGSLHTSGGVRFRAPNDIAWTYRNLGDYSQPLQYDEYGSTEMMSKVLYNGYPIEQCMESQMAASMATELGINPTTDPASPNYFDFYGNTYYYRNVPGFDGLQEGRMNTRVYKLVNKSEVSAYKDKAATTFEVNVILLMSLFNGANLSGDISAYNGGGLEIVGSCTVDPDNNDFNDPEFDPEVGNKIDIYVEPDQTKWHSETVISKDGLDQVFGFEALYRHVLETTNLGGSYTLTREGFTPWKTAKASSLVHGECYCHLDDNGWGHLNQRVRISSIFRGGSYYYNSSPRFMLADKDVSNANPKISGSVQTLIEL